MVLHFAIFSEKATQKTTLKKFPKHNRSAQQRTQRMVKFCLTEHSLHFFAVLISVGCAVQSCSPNISGSMPLPPESPFSHQFSLGFYFKFKTEMPLNNKYPEERPLIYCERYQSIRFNSLS